VQKSLINDLGLRGPKPGSTRKTFLLVAVGGAVIGVFLGHFFYQPTPESTKWLLVASLIFWQPFIEELLFRGAIQGYFQTTTWGTTSRGGITAANVVCSLLFVVSHLLHQPVYWAAATFVPSLIFGYYRDRTGSIWPPLLLHSLFNAAFFWQLLATAIHD
jgi:CAAX protease family protein